MSGAETIRVECYAGYKAEQEPRAVWLEDGRHVVVGIGDRWLDQHADYFRVRTDDGLLLLLRRDRLEDRWTLVKREMLDA